MYTSAHVMKAIEEEVATANKSMNVMNSLRYAAIIRFALILTRIINASANRAQSTSLKVTSHLVAFLSGQSKYRARIVQSLRSKTYDPFVWLKMAHMFFQPKCLEKWFCTIPPHITCLIL